jgi:hypothetical protein
VVTVILVDMNNGGRLQVGILMDEVSSSGLLSNGPISQTLIPDRLLVGSSHIAQIIVEFNDETRSSISSGSCCDTYLNTSARVIHRSCRDRLTLPVLGRTRMTSNISLKDLDQVA